MDGMDDDQKQYYCSDGPDGIGNFTNAPDCQNWCVHGGKGKCDKAAAIYCSYNTYPNCGPDDDCIPNSQLCSCINSMFGNPQCGGFASDHFTQNCRNGGYYTNNMNQMIEDAACPTQYCCIQNWNVSGKYDDEQNNIMKQLCGTSNVNSSDNSNESIQQPDHIVHTTTFPGTDINLPNIPGMPQEDIILGFSNTLFLIILIIVGLVLFNLPWEQLFRKKTEIVSEVAPINV